MRHSYRRRTRPAGRCHRNDPIGLYSRPGPEPGGNLKLLKASACRYAKNIGKSSPGFFPRAQLAFSVLLGSTTTSLAKDHSESLQSAASATVAERLSAIREAVLAFRSALSCCWSCQRVPQAHWPRAPVEALLLRAAACSIGWLM